MKIGPFSTTKTIDMYDYLKPTQRCFKPENFALNVGTNNISLRRLKFIGISLPMFSNEILKKESLLSLMSPNMIV